MSSIFLVLVDIRSAHNVGAIFRTADALGIKKIYLTGYTPAPIDRFGRIRSDVAKAALGAEKTVEWEAVTEPVELLRSLQKSGVQLIAIEQGERSVDYKTVTATLPAAFIVGNEVEGLPDSILSQVDVVAEIPMKGKKESLNVATALGVALFRILNI